MKKVTAYESEDGKIFKTEQDAMDQDLKVNISQFLEQISMKVLDKDGIYMYRNELTDILMDGFLLKVTPTPKGTLAIMQALEILNHFRVELTTCYNSSDIFPNEHTLAYLGLSKEEYMMIAKQLDLLMDIKY